MSGLTRRGILGASIASLAPVTMTPAAMLPTHPDAELLDLCAEFHEAHNASHAADDDSWEAILAERWEISNEIDAIRPTTDAGRLAVAGVALVLMEENGDPGSSAERFAIGALRDLVGRTGS